MGRQCSATADLPRRIAIVLLLLPGWTSWIACDRPAPEVPAGTSTSLESELDTYLAQQVANRRIPGMAAAVVRGGKGIYAGAAGVPKLGGSDKLTPRHVFHLASISKTFTATAVMQLVEKATYWLLPDDRIGIVMASNWIETPRETVMEELLDLVLRSQ